MKLEKARLLVEVKLDKKRAEDRAEEGRLDRPSWGRDKGYTDLGACFHPKVAALTNKVEIILNSRDMGKKVASTKHRDCHSSVTRFKLG